MLQRYCTQRSNMTTPQGVKARQRELRLFVDWLCQRHPTIDTFADVGRSDVEAYLEHLRTAPRPKHNRPLGIASPRQIISYLRQFFGDTSEWEYEHVPGRQLIGRADSPRASTHIPRFIPEQELAAVMQAIRELRDPHQRAALLAVRWSGARRDEIRRLELDCLDAYPDGTPRLRIPAGKTKTERMVPIAAEAADAITEAQTRRTDDHDLGMTDRVTERHHGDGVFSHQRRGTRQRLRQRPQTRRAAGRARGRPHSEQGTVTQQIDWLKSNYLKSELELGACLKLPDEGPCECDLFLTCAKFFTTAEHAPRIRRRWHREQELINDALERGWQREVERHEALARRCVDLLAELGLSLDGDIDDDLSPLC